MHTKLYKKIFYLQSSSYIKLIVSFLLLVNLYPAFSDTGKYKFGAFDYPVFYQKDITGINGISVDIAEELSKRLNIESSYTMYPLKRALSNMEKGSLDVMMGLIKTPEREKYLEYSVPVLTVRGLIWYSADRREGAPEVNTIEDLKSYKIGITSGYSYGREFDDFLKSVKVDPANTDYQNYRKLMAHRIDVFPGNEIVAKGLFRRNPELAGKFLHLDNNFIEWTLYMTVSRKSPLSERISDINRTLSDMIKEGIIDNIISDYTD